MYYIQIELKTDFGYSFRHILSIKGKTEFKTSLVAQKHADKFNSVCENNDRAIVLQKYSHY